MNKRKNIFTAFFILIYSLTLFFVLINNLADRTHDHWKFFYMFTQQSNILVLIWFILLSIYLITNSEKLRFVKNRVLMTSLTVYISITYFIVALVLDPIYSGKFNPVSSGSEFWLHHLTPVVTWVVFAIIPGEGDLTIKKSLAALIYPLIFVIVNLIVGSSVKYFDGEPAYAYGFINPNSYGGNYFMLLIVILGLLLVFSAFTIGLTKFKLFIDSTKEEV